MQTIKDIFKIGHGPSSSHTMGPGTAAEMFIEKQPNAANYRITLYGSLAATGKGHLTFQILEEKFEHKKLEILSEPKTFLPRHPNALKFEALDENMELIESWTAYSVGGGSVVDDNTKTEQSQLYRLTDMQSILKWCYNNGKHIWEYTHEVEGEELFDHLEEVWRVMKASIQNGIDSEGPLPGALKLPRRAGSVYAKAKNFRDYIKKRSMLYAYALAVSEENASGRKIVTAPTCGASGVLPAVLYYHQKFYKSSDSKIIRALATAGLIGNLVKFNASISGAEVGCQGEVGTACAMASAALTQLSGGSIFQIEYAAELGLEHHLGLTCDPVMGLVQIPCIERNAMAAARALNHTDFALLSDGRHFISFDRVVKTMNETGKDLPSLYRETSTGGLARFFGVENREID